MATYTTSEKVFVFLPEDLPSSVINYITTDIADASSLVDARVGSRFGTVYENNTQKFPNIGSTPPTPAIIELAARYLAISQQFSRLGETVSEGEVSQAELYEQKADKLFAGIESNLFSVEISGESIKSSALDVVQDEIYETTDEPVHNTDDLNEHLY